jgi:hypothetical protein
MKIYVQANSKKEVNELLKSGKKVYGENMSLFGGGGTYSIDELADGDVVAIYAKMSDGNPVTKSWGSYDKAKNLLK